MLEIAGGIILAVLVLRFWPFVLAAGVVLVAVGLVALVIGVASAFWGPKAVFAVALGVLVAWSQRKPATPLDPHIRHV